MGKRKGRGQGRKERRKEGKEEGGKGRDDRVLQPHQSTFLVTSVTQHACWSYSQIITKNCSLSIVLTATDQKLQKSLRR